MNPGALKAFTDLTLNTFHPWRMHPIGFKWQTFHPQSIIYEGQNNLLSLLYKTKLDSKNPFIYRKLHKMATFIVAIFFIKPTQ
jgi:hypothetical protein